MTSTPAIAASSGRKPEHRATDDYADLLAAPNRLTCTLTPEVGITRRSAYPICHRTRESIEPHLSVVFAALAISRHLQNATGMSIRKIVRTLRPLEQISIRIAGHEHLAEDPLTPAAETILDALNLSPQ